MYLNDNAEFCGDGIRYYSICIYILCHSALYFPVHPCLFNL